MTEKQLKQIANDFLQENYQLTLDIPIYRNNRLRTTHGRYIVKRNDIPYAIELAGKTLDYGTRVAIIGILKHECIHYALHRLGKPNKDGHPVFENELKKHKAPSTYTMKIGKYYTFSCEACHKTYETMRKRLASAPHLYRTACCQSTLKVTGQVYYDGFSKKN